MKYYRVHTADIAYITQQPRGLFTAIGKLVDAKTLTQEETAEYWKIANTLKRFCQFRPSMNREIQTMQLLGSRTIPREMIFTGRWTFTVPWQKNMV